MKLAFTLLAVALGTAHCRAILGIDDDAPLLPDGDRDAAPDVRQPGVSDAGDAGDGGPSDVDRTEPHWPLPAQSPPPANYEVTESTVLDKTTGLMWQRRVTSRDTYAWPDAMAGCTKLDLEGYRDWRLPTRIEMISLFDYGENTEYINPSLFPEDARYSWQWTASVYVAQRISGARWVVGTSSASVWYQSESSSDKQPQRCVRAGKSSTLPRFSVHGNTVFDARTGLTWEKALGAPMDFNNAKQRCEQLQPAGFRLPDVRELQTLIDEKQTEVPIAYGEFDPPAAVTSAALWSSTVRTRPNTAYFFVDFEKGTTKLSMSDTRAGARCVRSSLP